MNYKSNAIVLLLAFSFPTAVLLTTGGCSHPKQRLLTGNWTMDAKDEAARRIEDVNKENDLLAAAAKSLSEKMGGLGTGTMSIEFQADGTLTTITDFPMAGGEKTGTWRWISFDTKTNSAFVETTLNDDTTMTKVTFMDDNTIKLIPPNLAPWKFEMRFRRDNGHSN